MKIDYISDVHIDFWCREINTQNPKFKKQLKFLIDTILPNKEKSGKVLIIAGDLGHYYKQDTEFLLEIKQYYEHIFLVPGNHDMYLVSDSIKKTYMFDSWNRVLEMKSFCRDNKGFHYLDGNKVVVDGISFAGCGMAWDGSYGKVVYPDCDMGELLGHWENVMNDANLMFMNGKDVINVPTAYGGRYTKPSFDPIEFFSSQKKKIEKIDGADVVVSHYGPKVPDDISETYKSDLTTSFYYFNGDDDIDRIKPKKWIYGHTHRKVNEVYKGCNMLCNPLGYPGENTYTVIKSFEIEEIE